MASNLCGNALSIECKGCNETFNSKREPLMLPCLHSFCKQCLEKSMKNEEVVDNKMACPTCNDRFPLPRNISMFPVNLRLSHLAKTTAVGKQAESKNLKCQKCESSPKDATTFLTNRYKFLCNQCARDYKRLVDDDDDLEFIDLSAFEKGEFRPHPPPPKCSKHKKQEIVFYCLDCKMLICGLCGQSDHNNHNKRSIEDTAENEKVILKELINGVDGALRTLDEALRGVEEMRGKVKISAKQANKRIDEACDQLMQAVENRRRALKERCQEIAEGKEDVLSNQMVSMEQLKKNLDFALFYAKDAIGNEHHEEVLSIKKQIEDRLIRMKKIYHSKSMELAEDDVIDTSLEMESLLDSIGDVGFFPSVPDHSKGSCNAGVRMIKGGKKKVSITLKDEKDSLLKTKCHFQHQLMKVGEDPDEYIPPKVTITQGNNNGTATLEFTPDQLGEYELTIMVRNKPIADPYKITATESRDYMLYQNEAAIAYKNVGANCFGVAVHDNGTVYVTNYSGHTIKVFKPDGGESNIGNNSAAGGSLYSPRGIALIGDTIYVASYSNHSIKMYLTDGTFIKSLGIGIAGAGDGQFNSPYGICTDGHDRVCVADYGNQRIQVFSSNGSFIKCIPCTIQPYDVAIDPDGNIHAALYGNHHMAVYSPQDGRQIETYNLGGNLLYPTGIYIDCKGNRLIACGGNNMVYIGDSKDTLLASKQINYAWDITMNDGLIYVTEYANNRVSVY